MFKHFNFFFLCKRYTRVLNIFSSIFFYLKYFSILISVRRLSIHIEYQRREPDLWLNHSGHIPFTLILKEVLKTYDMSNDRIEIYIKCTKRPLKGNMTGITMKASVSKCMLNKKSQKYLVSHIVPLF